MPLIGACTASVKPVMPGVILGYREGTMVKGMAVVVATMARPVRSVNFIL